MVEKVSTCLGTMLVELFAASTLYLQEKYYSKPGKLKLLKFGENNF